MCVPLLSEGQSVQVSFIDRSVWTVRLEQGYIILEKTNLTAGRGFSESVDSAFEVSSNDEVPNKRDGARHFLMRAASTNLELWDLIGLHFSELQADMRPNVLNAIVAGSPNRADRAWALGLLEASQEKKLLTPEAPAPKGNVVDFRDHKARQAVEQKKAQRRAKDAAVRAQMKGSSQEKPLHKQGGKKKK